MRRERLGIDTNRQIKKKAKKVIDVQKGKIYEFTSLKMCHRN